MNMPRCAQVYRLGRYLRGARPYMHDSRVAGFVNISARLFVNFSCHLLQQLIANYASWMYIVTEGHYINGDKRLGSDLISIYFH